MAKHKATELADPRRVRIAPDYVAEFAPFVTVNGLPVTGTELKFMAPGHFCPDVCGIEDFGPADYLRGRIVRGFFRVMRLWPKSRGAR